MGLISRSTRGGSRGKSRGLEPLKSGSKGNRNRRTTTGVKKTYSFKGVGIALGWVGTALLGVAVAGFLSVGLLYGYRYLTNSAYFSVKSLEVTGNFRLSSRELLDNAGLHEGMNALLVSIDAVERKLAEDPWLESVSVKRILPDGIRIRVKEREPRFWVRRGETLFYADAAGKAIMPVRSSKFASFPVLEVEPGAEDMKGKLPELLASLAEARLAVNAASVSRVRLSPGRGVEVFLENNRLILSIGQEEWTENLRRLAATLADLAKRGEIKGVREVRVHGAGVWVIKRAPAA